jgi:uncharacterized protein YbcI
MDHFDNRSANRFSFHRMELRVIAIGVSYLSSSLLFLLTMERLTKSNVRKVRLRERLRQDLEEFLRERIGGSGRVEVKIVDNLILVRCKEALSPSEVDLGATKVGRSLLQEVSERLCQELKPNLNTLLYGITGLRLLDVCVGLFVEQREKIYLFIMSGAVKE